MTDKDREFLKALNNGAQELQKTYRLPDAVKALFKKLDTYVNEDKDSYSYINCVFMHENHMFTNLCNYLDDVEKFVEKLHNLCESGGYHGSVGFTLISNEGKAQETLEFINGQGKEKFEEFSTKVWDTVQRLKQEYGQARFDIAKVKYNQARSFKNGQAT